MANGDQRPDSKGRIFVQPYGWVTPVRSRSGQILYYLDANGARVGDPLAGPGSGGATSYSTVHDGSPSGIGGVRDVRRYGTRDEDTAKRIAADRAKRQDPVTGVQGSQTQALDAVNQGYAWIDGKRFRQVGVDAETGFPTYTLDGKGDPTDDGKPYVLSPPTAYLALDGDSVPDGSTQFLMGIGPRRDANNVTHLGISNIFHLDTFGGQNYMTIANGLTWLANLSSKDKSAYQALVTKLHDAHYLSDAELAGAGGYNQDVALAFAKAARDTAVLNGQGGDNAFLTLDAFLSQTAAGNAALAAAADQAAYVPVQRDYTDPEEVKAAAHTAAEQTLGRRLTPAEEAELVGHFRSLENGMFDQVDAAGRQGQKGTFTRPSEAGQVSAFLDSGDLDQESANWRAAQYGNAIKDLFTQRTQLT